MENLIYSSDQLQEFVQLWLVIASWSAGKEAGRTGLSGISVCDV